MKKAFIFSLEALLTLLFAVFLVFSLPYLRLSTYSDVYHLELVGDFQKIAAQKYYSETVAFSKGDPTSANLLEYEYSNLIDQLGNFCLQIEARGNKIEINCQNKSGFKTTLTSNNLWFDGNEFFEHKMSLKS